MEGGGWSVADTARPATLVTSSRPSLRSPGDGGQSPSNNGRDNSEFSSNNGQLTKNVYSKDSVAVKRGQHYFELQRTAFEQKTPTPTQNSTFRSNSQEELDKLLAGLDKLTETLPDLNTVRSYSALSGSEKPIKACNGGVDTVDKKFSNNFTSTQNDIYRSVGQIRDSGTPDRQLALIRPSVIVKQSASASGKRIEHLVTTDQTYGTMSSRFNAMSIVY